MPNATGGGPGAGTRPYREADAGFSKEKIRGKMQAGAITGLSHFRGQGAKGDAPKEYVEALISAEQKATSSMELDQIPADGRRMVKEYFLQLKQDALPNATPPPTPEPAKDPPGGTLKE
jgi:hypothetical protein